jgi:KDO2-lipid IV(A) lauroyltransferase
VNLTALAWKWVPRLPEGLARAGFAGAADWASWRRGKGVRQLEANLRRVCPDLDRRALRRLVREAMRRYMRYYCEAFQLGKWPPERATGMVRLANEDRIRAELGESRRRPDQAEVGGANSSSGSAVQAVLALGHLGNWDLAGAWATRNLAPITTVAERLRPEEVFQDFLAMRRHIGLNIIALEPNKPVFRRLLEVTRKASAAAEPWLVPLLADRDLGRGGLEVDFFGEKALMAPGPAALALATGRPLYAVAMYREGAGYVLEFSDLVEAPPGLAKAEQVAAMTQSWASFLEDAIRRHPADWHMLQKVFVADLDPARRARRNQAAPVEHDPAGRLGEA